MWGGVAGIGDAGHPAPLGEQFEGLGFFIGGLAVVFEVVRDYRRFAVPDQHLVIGGHKLPFTGLPRRMNDLIENHHSGLNRLVDHIAEPKTAVECFSPLFKREIVDEIYGLAMVEAYAHLQHLHKIGRASRTLREDGAFLWQAI